MFGWPRSAPHSSSLPLSHRLCDWVTAAFALWTLSTHAVAAAGGGLRHLLFVAAAAGAVTLGAWWIAGARRPLEAAEVAPARARLPDVVSLLCALAAAGVVAGYMATDEFAVLWWGALAVLTAGLVVLARREMQPPAVVPPSGGRRTEGLLWAVALSTLSLWLLSDRIYWDSLFYVGMAASAVDDPAAPLMLDPLYGIPGLPLHMPAHRTHSHELLSAAVSYLTGLTAWNVYFWITASGFALLAPFGFARLFRLLAPRHWIWCAVLIWPVLLGVAAPNWYGWFSATRMAPGKSVFLTFFLPLAWAYGMEFGARPSVRRWLLLAAVQIASIGATSSALWCVPIVSGLGVACTARLDRTTPRVFGLAVASSIYVVAFGLSLKGAMAPAAELVRLSGEPGSALRGAVGWTLGAPGVVAVSLFCLLGGWALLSGAARRFAVLAPFALLLLLFNPYLEDQIARNLTGPSLWRLVWILPVPTLLVLVATAALEWASPRGRRVAGVAAVAVTGLFVTFVPESNLVFDEEMVVLHTRPQKMGGSPGRLPARILVAVAPRAGSALAPPDVAPFVAAQHRHPPLVYVRGTYLRAIAERYGDEEAELRLRMAFRVAEERPSRVQGPWDTGQEPLPLDAFGAALADHHVRAVVLANRAPDRESIDGLLTRRGFEKKWTGSDYAVWTLLRPRATPRRPEP